MEIFENKTLCGCEKAIKIGTNVIQGDAILAWFSEEEVLPSNSISIVDLSNRIPENKISDTSYDSSQPIVVYADELGFLRKEDGSYDFSTNDVTISNLFLDKATSTERLYENSIDSKNFVHHYYVSRFFQPAPDTFSLVSKRQFLSEERISTLKIKVVDENNREYYDQELSRKKYRILLEPFRTDDNSNKVEIPYRIIVLLDHTPPKNLRLIYDKVECDDYGNMLNLQTQYSETINSVPFYKEIPEESFVIDDNYYQSDTFSIKKINEKYSDIFGANLLNTGYQIVAPSKAISDYRTFEVFNWRAIVRSRVNINFDEINYGNEYDSSGNIIQKTVKVAVLYSSASNQAVNSLINPYVFLRLQNSPFNLSKYTFVNPLSNETDKNNASYWKLDIDSVESIKDYDYVAWSPSSSVTPDQQAKIEELLYNNGTILLDLSSPSANFTSLNNQLQKDSTLVGSNNINLIEDSVVIDYRKNGGWTITTGIFEKQYYGIHGSNLNVGKDTYKKYLYFNSAASSKVFIRAGETTSSYKDIGIVIDYPSSGDSLAKGNIIGCTFPIMSYCNSIYNASSPEQVLDSNYGDVTFDADGLTQYSAILEGPLKFLYNSISYALYSKALSSRQIDIRNSLFNFVTKWKSSWVMDSEALLEEEKEEYFTKITVDSNSEIYSRDITKDFSNIFNLYKSEMSELLPEVQRSILSTLKSSDVEIFIEVTNPDVEILDTTTVDVSSFESEENIPSSYYLHKVNFNERKLFAYTTVPSAKLEVPSQMGPYVIRDKSFSSSSTRRLNNELNVLSSFKSYPFNLSTAYNYARATDKPTLFDVNFNATLNGVLTGSLTYSVVVKPGTPEIPSTNPSPGPAQVNCTEFKSAIDDLKLLRKVDITSSDNIFPYTGDIDLHYQTKIWTKQNSTSPHAYVKYIQTVLKTAGKYSGPYDGVYGSSTEAAVRAFQSQYNLKWEDGKVDSETKYHLALYIRLIKVFENQKFQVMKAFALPEVKPYIEAAENMVLASEINSGRPFRKTTFSGVEGPKEGSDILFFTLPTGGIEKIEKLIIEPDSSLKWKYFTVKEYGYSSTYSTNIFNYKIFTLNANALNGNIEINLGSMPKDNVKYFWVRISGDRPLVGHDKAEGFGINRIYVKGINTIPGTPGTPGTDPVTENVIITDLNVNAVIKTSETASNVSTANPYNKSFATNNLNRSTSYVESISWQNPGTGITFTKNFSVNQYKLNDNTEYEFDGLKIRFSNLPKSVSLQTASIASITSQGVAVSGSPVILTIPQVNRVNIDTSSVYFSGSQIVNVNNILNNYRLRRLDGTLLSDTRNIINVNDGILLLCKENGNPYGLPASSEILAAASGITSMGDEEIDLRYGFFTVSNAIAQEDGFIYGFYDINEREFIGKNIYYTDLVARGPQNIFVAVCAYDADGNTQNKNEYIGPKVDTTFIPVNVPLKIICPVYSLKYNSGSSIKIGKMDDSRSKFDIWELPIKTGSFWKNVDISSEKNWPDWKEYYKGQSLMCHYSTVDSLDIIWSDIYGYGSYDVFDENPILISDKKIKIRRAPILSWNYPTNYQTSLFGIIKPIIKIYTRESISSDWQEMQYSQIRDINCKTGVVEFNRRIVPSDSSLIKVSYTTENKDVLLRQIDSDPVPLNPVLNKGSIQYDRPMYVYILPTKIYKKQNSDLNNNLVRVSEYENSNSINYTYDSEIFNENSSKYNPIALQIGIVYVYRNPYKQRTTLQDLRLRGGGVASDVSIDKLKESIPTVLSHWDVYPPEGMAYNKGGYVIIRMPEEVKNNFVDPSEVYQIIENNLTAGVVYELQDMQGRTWS